MNKFVLFGNYTTEAMRGFIAQPDQNRRVAAEMIAEAVGAEVLDFFLTKGEHDFVAVGQGTSSQILAIKMATMSSGALCNGILPYTILAPRPSFSSLRQMSGQIR